MSQNVFNLVLAFFLLWRILASYFATVIGLLSLTAYVGR